MSKLPMHKLCVGILLVAVLSARAPGADKPAVTLTVDEVKAKLPGYWRVTVKEEDVRKDVELSTNGGHPVIIEGKVIDNPNADQRRVFMEKELKQRMEQIKQLAEDSLAYFAANGTTYDLHKAMGVPSRVDKWSVALKDEILTLTIAGEAELAVRSADADNLVLEGQPGPPDRLTRVMTLVRVKDPPQWAKDLMAGQKEKD